MRTSIDNRIQKGLNAEYVEEPSEVITETIKQMKEYFDLERKEFTIPLLLVGLVGYAGGLDVKKRLLEIERNLFTKE
jgi:O6-methylguanine-DNA--protein-cysteine methyltransferase